MSALKSPDATAKAGSRDVACDHCGLPVPRGLLRADAARQFCCSGCSVAYQLIHEHGLEAYYQMAASDRLADGRAAGEAPGQHAYDTYDEPEFQKTFGVSGPPENRCITLQLEGIHCAACLWLLEKLPRIVPGTLQVQLNWARQTARIHWNDHRVQLSQIATVLHRLGYRPHPVRENEHQRRFAAENRTQLIRLGVAAAAAGNNMLIAAALYLGMFSYMAADMHQMLRVASCAVGLLSLLWPGRVFLRGAWSAIRTRTAHMDLPIALGLAVGGTAGVVNTIRGQGEIYFDSLSVLVFLLLLGRWLQFRQQHRAADAVDLLYRLTPQTTRRVVDERPIETFVDLVQPGDLLEIRAGEMIPVDAVIETGSSAVDESILSGESRLQPRGVGDPVLAGTQNQQATIRIRAQATGQQTRLAGIVDLVEQAALSRPPIVEWANRIGGYFVVTVMVLAVATGLYWALVQPESAVDRTVALLIVACPCALALATPLAVSVALGRAARRRIMIKGGDVLQLLNRPGKIWLDKTGTLTDGQLEVTRYLGDRQWAAWLGEIERQSSHPVARAIEHWAPAAGDLPPVEDFQAHDGQGVSARMGSHRFLIGNRALLATAGLELSPAQEAQLEAFLADSLSPCLVAVDDEVTCLLAIGDRLRPDAPQAVERLRQGGWSVGILSGDHQDLVQQIGRRLGLPAEDCLGELGPEAKVAQVRQSAQEHPVVVMVGDGVNDSAALAAASVGIAVHHGAEASLAAAPVYLADPGLQPILQLIEISRRTQRTIVANFSASLGYNLLGASLAMTGWINPLVAAILMPISSLTVVGLSMTAGRTPSRDSS